MAGWTAPPVLVQVAALAAVAVIAAQIVTFALIVLALLLYRRRAAIGLGALVALGTALGAVAVWSGPFRG